MMTRTNRYPLSIEQHTYIIRMNELALRVSEIETYSTRFLQPTTVNLDRRAAVITFQERFFQLFAKRHFLFEKLLFIQAADIIQRLAKGIAANKIGCAGLELIG